MDSVKDAMKHRMNIRAAVDYADDGVRKMYCTLHTLNLLGKL